jgi:hypothetical protein
MGGRGGGRGKKTIKQNVYTYYTDFMIKWKNMNKGMLLFIKDHTSIVTS